MRLRKQQRLALAGGVVLLSAGAAALALTALRQQVTFFVDPAKVASGAVAPGQRFRLGGLVVPGSLQRQPGGTVQFTLTDNAGSVPVLFQGILPDLFREGQGIISEGSLDAEGRFVATEVLAKHDENYMPVEVADALKRSGHWRDGEGAAAAPSSSADASTGLEPEKAVP